MRSLKILSLGNDEEFSSQIRRYMEDEGADFRQASTGASCLELLNIWTPDIVLLDLDFVDVDGLTLITQIKGLYDGAFIVISGKSSTTDKILGLEMGADDYIVKPFEMRELAARIRANVRRVSQAISAIYSKDTQDEDDMTPIKFDEYSYDPATFQLYKDGVAMDLTTGEIKLLCLFFNAGNRVLSREFLYEQIHGNIYDPYDRSIDVQITRIRKKLGDEPSQPKYIKTVRGLGYVFVAEITKK